MKGGKTIRDVCGHNIQDPYPKSFDAKLLQLTSLLGCPAVVEQDFYCSQNLLDTLQYCPKHVGRNFVANYNKLRSLQNIHKHCTSIGYTLLVMKNPISSHILGVMLIEDVTEVMFSVDFMEYENIINTHLKTDRDVFICQDNLIKAGFAEYAQL
jgi:hypothetical protein